MATHFFAEIVHYLYTELNGTCDKKNICAYSIDNI